MVLSSVAGSGMRAKSLDDPGERYRQARFCPEVGPLAMAHVASVGTFPVAPIFAVSLRDNPAVQAGDHVAESRHPTMNSGKDVRRAATTRGLPDEKSLLQVMGCGWRQGGRKGGR